MVVLPCVTEGHLGLSAVINMKVLDLWLSMHLSITFYRALLRCLYVRTLSAATLCYKVLWRCKEAGLKAADWCFPIPSIRLFINSPGHLCFLPS